MGRALARNEPNTVKRLELAPIDLAKLAFDVTMEWVPEAYRKKIDLGFDGANEHVMVQGDATRLSELIVNLLDNAIRYSREGGRVTVRVTGHPRPSVSISDDGPTIPVAERQRVFERAKDKGWIPADCALTERDEALAAWNDMPEDEKPFR